MADDLKLKIQLEATSDKRQVESEAKEVAKTANDALKVEKMRLQLDKTGLEKELKNLLTEISKAKVKWDKDLEFYATLEAKSVINQISAIDKQVTDLDKKMTWWTPTATGGLLWKLKNFVAKWALIAWVTKLWKTILELWMNAEQARISFTTMLWSAEDAEVLLKQLSDFAKNSTFDLQWVRESAKQLLAMGISAQDMIPTLKALWDVSAWLSVPMERLALNYGQVITQWKLTWKELKDFTTAWVPLLDELAKNLWKTKTGIQDMVSAGQIGAQDMVEAFRTMTEEWWRFANLNEAQSKTLQGQWNNFMETLAWIGEQIWLAVIPMLTDMLQSTTEATEWLNNMGDKWLTAWEAIAWGIHIAGDGIRWLVKIIQGVWTFIGTLFSSIRTLASGVFQDIQAVTVNLATNSKDIFSAMWNNIKVGILKWVQSAINWLNKLLSWADEYIWIDLWKIWDINTWEYQSVFWGDLFKNTKNAVEWINLAWDDAMNDIWKDWSNFAEKITKEQENIKKTFRWTAKDIKNSVGGALWDIAQMASWSGWGGGWWSSKSVVDASKEMKDEMKNLYSEMDTAVKDHQKSYDNLVKNIEKTEKELDKLRETASKTWEDAEKSLKKYNEQLEQNQVDSLEKLGQRYVELREKRAETDNDYLKKIVWEISDKEWQLIRDEWWTFRGYDYSELKDVYELYKEMKLIEENTTEEQRKASEFTEKTSRAQEILNQMKEKEAELEEKKAQALEKQAIAQAMMNQENGKTLIKTLTKDGEDIGTFYYDAINEKWEQVHDAENIEYAKQLENQSVNLNDQLKQYQAEKDNEVEILTDVTARKIQLEKEYDKTFQEAVAKQKKSVSELISYWDRLIERKNSYYSSSSSARAYGWDITNAKVTLVWENWPEQIIARQASYVQPRNASNTYSTVNNTDNSFSINWMQVNVNNIDEFLDDLRWRLTYRD